MFELSILLASLSPIEVKSELKASAIADAFVTSLSGSLISLTVAVLLVLRELSVVSVTSQSREEHEGDRRVLVGESIVCGIVINEREKNP